MGFLDKFKRKRAEFLNARQVDVHYGFECPECSAVHWFYANLNVIDNEHYVYVLMRSNHTGELEPVKLPIALIRLNEQEGDVVEGVHDKVGQDLIELEKAVIDRIVDGKTAVILVGDDERQHHYPVNGLPAGAREGTWLRVQIENGGIMCIEVDREETESALRRIQAKMDKLRERGRKST